MSFDFLLIFYSLKRQINKLNSRESNPKVVLNSIERELINRNEKEEELNFIVIDSLHKNKNVNNNNKSHNS